MPDKQFPETTFTLHEDRTRATIKIGGETVVVDAASLQNFIGHLGQLREGMRPEVPSVSPQDRRFLQIGGPVVEIDPSDDGSIVRLALRTPTYGWIGFQFLPEQAAEVGRHLVGTYGGREAAAPLSQPSN